METTQEGEEENWNHKAKNKQKEKAEEEENPSGLWIRDKEDNGTATLAYLWTNMLLFRKATGTWKQTKPKIRDLTLHCVYNEFIPEHAVSVGLIILALVHFPIKKTKMGTFCDCAIPGPASFVHYPRAASVCLAFSVWHRFSTTQW